MGNKVLKLIKYVVVIAVSLVVGRVIATYIFNANYPEHSKSLSAPLQGSHPSPPSVEAALRNLAQNTNQKLPMMIDSNTRLDWTLSSAKSMTLLYTLLDSDQWKTQDSDKLKSDLSNRVCKDEIFTELLPLGAILTYSYRSKDGTPLFALTIQASDCK